MVAVETRSPAARQVGRSAAEEQLDQASRIARFSSRESAEMPTWACPFGFHRVGQALVTFREELSQMRGGTTEVSRRLPASAKVCEALKL